MSVVGSVTAELVLDTKGFSSGIQTAMDTVQQLESSFKTMGSTVSSKQFDSLLSVLEKTNNEVSTIRESVSNLNRDLERVKSSAKGISDPFKEWKQWFKETNAEANKLQKKMESLYNAEFIKQDFTKDMENIRNGFQLLDKEITVTGENVVKLERQLTLMKEAIAGERGFTILDGLVAKTPQVIAELDKIKASLKTLVSKTGERFNPLNIDESVFSKLQNVINYLERVKAEEIGDPFDKLCEGARKAVSGLEKVHEESAKVRAELQIMDNTANLSKFNGSLLTSGQNIEKLSLSTKNSTTSMSNWGNTTSRAGNQVEILNSSVGKGVNNVQTLGTSYNTTSGSMAKFGNSTQNANSRLKEHWSQLYRLTSALHSLKVVLSTVSSMFIWTFGMSLWEATKQTISSKNEMTSYLEQMGKGEGEIRSFNAGLDETVEKFQKLNKFMIGETIAGIGAEFDLSIDEMKKSMEVVAMIQNEYVRAGRKESEASLAVKDILQGEFLRLSRETGVGKQDLIDTGKWSGDLKDVMGLMEALKEVGESRHWDLFASKCRSLNDVISATKNRISEFTSTLIDELSPSIVSTFNTVIDIVDGATESFNNMGVFEKILLGVGAFYALSTATMLLAGNVNLLDIAMYGYNNSLLATIFQVDVATVKEQGLLKAITAKITGIRAEQVAELGVAKAIATKLLGLDAEIVKEHGLKTAIATAVAMRNLDTSATEANTAVNTINNTTMEISSALYTVNTTETEANTTAKIANEGANLGVLRTLVMMVTGMEAETVASMSATSALWAFISATTVLEAITIVGVLVGVAVAFATVAKSIQDTCSQMKEYNDLIGNSDETIQALKDAYQEMQDEQNALTQQYYNGTLSADEYNQKLDELGLTTRDLEQASKDLETAIDNIDYAGKFAKTIDNKKIITATKTNRELAEVMKAQGYDDTQIQSVGHYQQLVAFGNKRLYEGLQVYNKQNDNFIENEKRMNEQLQKNNVSIEDREKWVGDLGEAYADLEEQSWIANTSDDWWEASWAKMGAGLAQMKIDWINFWADPELSDVVFQALNLLFDIDGLLESLDVSGISKALEDAWNSVNWGEILKPLTDFDKMFNEWSENAKQTIDDWVNHFTDICKEGKLGEEILKLFNLDNISLDDIIKPLQDAFGKAIDDFLADPFGMNSHGSGGGTGIAKKIDGKALMNAIFGGIDFEGISQWVNDFIVKPFSDALNNFIQDPFGAIVDGALGGFSGIGDLLGNLFGDTTEGFTNFVQEKIAIPLQDEINLFMADPIGYMGGLIQSLDITNLLGSLLGFGGEDADTYTTMYDFVMNSIITPFSNAISTGLASIPIVGDILSMLGLIDSTTPTASQKGTDIGNAFGIAVENFIRNIPIVGDILSWLGLIDGTTGTAHSKGDAVGSNIKQGVNDGKQGTAQTIRDEVGEIISALANRVGEAYAKAQAIGSAILNGINSVIQHHSPGIPAQLIDAEMGEIVLAMDNAYNKVYTSAQGIGQAITNGIQPTGEFSFDADAVAQYQSNTALAVGMADETVVSTESAFSDLDFSTMTTFASIGNTVGSTMTNIANNTRLNYTNIANTTKTQLANMQSQTTKNIGAIKQSWTGMQTALIQSAEHIRSETGAKINSLQNNMATFWRKVQNPALLLGAGNSSEEKSVKSRRYGSRGSGVRKILQPKGYAGSSSSSRSPLKVAPNSPLQGISSISADKFNDLLKGFKDKRFSSTTPMNALFDYLMCLINGNGECVAGKKCGYAGGWDFNWSDDIKRALLQWHTHFGEIYDPYLYVGKFENDNFPIRGIAPIARNYIYDAISRTQYEYYFDSKYGDPLSIWNAGHFNCYDGAILVMALARALGFPNSTIVHGSWGGTPHVWARIAGLGDIDATAIQGGYGFTAPSRTGAGSPAISRFKHNKTPSSDNGGKGDIHIHIDMSGATVTDDSIGERIGKKVRGEIIDLINPSPSTGY